MGNDEIQKSLWAIGIDLGTTKSALAYFPRTTRDDRVPPIYPEYIIDISEKSRRKAVPTAIAINNDSIKQIGNLKLLIGRQAYDIHQIDYEKYTLIADLKNRLMASDNTSRSIKIGEKDAPVEGVTSSFLWKLVSSADGLDLRRDTYGITISVPAKAHVIQRMSTKFALAVTGFEQQIDLVEEPVSAFLYHKHMKPDRFMTQGRPRYALVVDFGGGTCDLAIIEYVENELPKVRGRSMGIFGGQVIDELLVKELWLDKKPKEKNVFQLTLDQYQALGQFEKKMILEIAKNVKEYISENSRGISLDMTGVSPYQTGEIESPVTTYNQLGSILENVKFDADYESVSNSEYNSLKGHLENLLKRVLDDAELPRSNISTLIFAGGSISLPEVKHWVKEFLRREGGIGAKNVILQESNIFDSDNHFCVAGGSAVHQLYRYHKRNDWRGAITPSLSESIWFVNHHPLEEKRKAILLGEKLEELPINKTSYLNCKEIIPIVSYMKDENEIVEIEIVQGDLSNSSIRINHLFANIFPKGMRSFLPRAILIRYAIDDYGMLQELYMTPGDLLSGWKWGKTHEEYNILTRDSTGDVNLRNIDSSNRNMVENLRKIYIPGG